MKKNNKRWMAIVAAALVMGGAGLYIHFTKSEEADMKTPSSPNVRRSTLEVSAIILKPETISEDIVSVGNIIPDEMVDLAFETSGKVVAIYFKEGTAVKKGDLLARINDAPLQAQLRKLEAELTLLESRIFRQKALLTREAISQETYEIIETDKEKLIADIELVKANIAQKELRASFDGVIGLRNISEGAFATTGTSIAKLIKTKPLKLEFSYPERYSNLIKSGTKINFTVTGELKPFKAEVYAVESIIDETRNQRARAIYPNADGKLMPGRFFSIKINLQEQTNALTIPSEAVLKEMGQDIIYRYKEGKVESLAVTLGIRTEDRIEIKAGVNVGDTIITSGMMQVRPGLPVKLSSIE
ncbi:MAG: efflux RND transporter periplasmic adaptor subunit [Phocaeicola sp.]